MFIFLAGSATASELESQRAQLFSAHAERLGELVQKCETLKLPAQAKITRDWVVPAPTDRQLLYLPAAKDPTLPPVGAPKIVMQWHAKFTKLRQQYAEELFALAEKAATKGRGDLAYRWSAEVLREYPDHKQARTVMGYIQVRGVWKYPNEMASVRTSRSHPTLPWRSYTRVETTHFEIVTNDSRAAGLELGRQLEMLHQVWQQLFISCWTDSRAMAARFKSIRIAPTPTAKFRVVLFRNRNEYVAHLTKIEPNIAISQGFYLQGKKTSYFYSGEDTLRTWYHEATHQLFHQTLRGGKSVGGDKNYWIVEGVALYMESLRKADTHCTVGGWDASRLQFARYRRLNQQFYVPLAELVTMGLKDVQQHKDIQWLYSQSAGLAHLLMDGQADEGRLALLRYLTAIYKGTDRPETLARAIGNGYGELDLAYSRFLQVTDDQLASLQPSHQLTNLCLGHTQVTDRGMIGLKGQKKLRWVDLAGVRITDAGAANLADAVELDQLNLESTGVSDDALSIIKRFSQLTELDLSNTRVSDAGMPNVANLRSLQTLWLPGTKVSDAGLLYLKNLRKLEKIAIKGSGATEDGFRSLKRSLPNLELIQ